jgi:hypothetical protein
MGMAGTLSSELGRGFGGNFPTSAEFLVGQLRQRSNTDLMQEAMMSDPRAFGLSDFAVNAAFGGNQKDISRFYGAMGGRGNVGSLGGIVMNMPRFSGMFGGDIRSVMFGSQSVAGGGMRINGTSIYGQGAVQDLAARSVFNRTMGNFFTQGGANIMSATHGLDMNQLGGIMSIGASQGVFNGLDLGKVETVNGRFQQHFNEGSLNKIKDFVQTAAKTMSTLIDVFGNQDIGSLASIAQKITGLDMNHVKMMDTKLTNIKATAGAMGVGLGEAMTTTMRAGAFGQQTLGMSQYVAGGVASTLAPQAMMMARMDSYDPRFNVHPMTMESYMASGMTNTAGFLRSNNGARIALMETMAQTGMLAGKDLDELRGLSGGMSGQRGINAWDRQFIRMTGKSPLRMISAFGGGEAMLNQMNPENLERTQREIDTVKHARQLRIIQNYSRALLKGPGMGDAAARLIGEFGSGAADLTGATAGAFSSDFSMLNGMPGGISSQISPVLLAMKNNGIMRDFTSNADTREMAERQKDVDWRKWEASREHRMTGAGVTSILQGSFQGADWGSNESMLAYSMRYHPWSAGGEKNLFGWNAQNQQGLMQLSPGAYKMGSRGLDEESLARFKETISDMPSEMLQMMATAGIDKATGKSAWHSDWSQFTGREQEIALNTNFKIFQNAFGTKESRMKMLSEWQVAEGSEGLQGLYRDKVMERDRSKIQRAVAYNYLAGATDPASSEVFRSVQDLLNQKFTSRTNYQKYVKDYAGAENAARTLAGRADTAMQLNDKTLKKIAVTSPEVADLMIEGIETAKDNSMTGMAPLSDRDYKKLTNAEQLLQGGKKSPGVKESGITAPSNVKVDPGQWRELIKAVEEHGM